MVAARPPSDPYSHVAAPGVPKLVRTLGEEVQPTAAGAASAMFSSGYLEAI